MIVLGPTPSRSYDVRFPSTLGIATAAAEGTWKYHWLSETALELLKEQEHYPRWFALVSLSGSNML